MPFNASKFTSVGGNSRSANAPVQWSYITPDDTTVAIEGTNYFGSMAIHLVANDLIYASAINADVIYIIQSVERSTKTVVLKPLHFDAGAGIETFFTPPPLSADQNDYAPTTIANRVKVWRLSTDGAGDRKITGMVPQQTSQSLTITNIGADIISFTHQDAASAAGNRIFTPNKTDIRLFAGQTIRFWYDEVSLEWLVFSKVTDNAFPQFETLPALTADVNDFAPTTITQRKEHWRMQTDGVDARAITGIVKQEESQELVITNVGPLGANDVITLLHESSLSLDANRIFSPSFVDIILSAGEAITLWYDEPLTHWRVISTTGS